MGEHDALGVAGGAGGVDDGGEFVGFGEQGLPAPRLRANRVGGAVSLQRLEREEIRAGQIGVESADPFERRKLAPDRGNLGKLGGGGHEHRAGPRVLQDVVDLAGRQGRVDRHVHGAGGERREVGEGPLGPILRQNCHPVSGGDA